MLDMLFSTAASPDQPLAREAACCKAAGLSLWFELGWKGCSQKQVGSSQCSRLRGN